LIIESDLVANLNPFTLCHFAALQKASFASAVYATANPSVHLSVRLTVCHIPVLCQNEGTQRDAVFTIG